MSTVASVAAAMARRRAYRLRLLTFVHRHFSGLIEQVSLIRLSISQITPDEPLVVGTVRGDGRVLL